MEEAKALRLRQHETECKKEAEKTCLNFVKMYPKYALKFCMMPAVGRLWDIAFFFCVCVFKFFQYRLPCVLNSRGRGMHKGRCPRSPNST